MTRIIILGQSIGGAVVKMLIEGRLGNFDIDYAVAMGCRTTSLSSPWMYPHAVEVHPPCTRTFLVECLPMEEFRRDPRRVQRTVRLDLPWLVLGPTLRYGKTATSLVLSFTEDPRSGPLVAYSVPWHRFGYLHHCLGDADNPPLPIEDKSFWSTSFKVYVTKEEVVKHGEERAIARRVEQLHRKWCISPFRAMVVP